MYTNRCRNLVIPRIDIEAAANHAAALDERLLSPELLTPELSGVSRSNNGLAMGLSTPRSPTKRTGAYRPSVFAHRVFRRAVLKNGYCNVAPIRGSRKRLRYLQDIFTTLVDARWRWTLMVFALGFIGSWLFFALLYWFISSAHGDLDPLNQESESWTPCIVGIYSYTSCFLFSLETQHTIGYGSRSTTEECPEAIFVMTIQSVHGVMIQALLAGIIFAKMTRSKSRSQTLLFSRHAVIAMRDGEPCLMFRVGDMRKSHIIGAKMRAQLIRCKVSREGESLPQYLIELDLEVDGSGSDLFFIWPQIVVHRINHRSPLWNLSAFELLHERFEIVVFLEGTIESTGQSTQARSSYLSNEIMWGYRFEPVLEYNKKRQGYEINFSKFDATIPTEMPVCSAKEMFEGAHYSSQENLVDKRPFEYSSLVEKLQCFHTENEASPQHPLSKSVCLAQSGGSGCHKFTPQGRSLSSNELKKGNNCSNNDTSSVC